MLTIEEAFSKFKSRLELTTSEQTDASTRQKRIRAQVAAGIDVEDDFLTGSYARHTKTKPLKDVDIFIVLGSEADHYRDKHPRRAIEAIHQILAPHYGEQRVKIARRSVRVDFGVELVDDLSDKVVSFDVVPAFTQGGHFVIADDHTGEWMPTNPNVHAEKATSANAALSGQWKPTVKMIKKWNEHNGKPIQPSFLIEVMAIDLLVAPWGGSYPREIKAFLATAYDTIDDGWRDPAGLGTRVSDRLDEDASLMQTAKLALREGEAACTEALRLEASGRTGAAFDVWQALFGPAFAKT